MTVVLGLKAFRQSFSNSFVVRSLKYGFKKVNFLLHNAKVLLHEFLKKVNQTVLKAILRLYILKTLYD